MRAAFFGACVALSAGSCAWCDSGDPPASHPEAQAPSSSAFPQASARPPATGATATAPTAPVASNPAPSGGCGKDPFATGFVAGQKMQIGGAARTYSVYVPATYDKTKGYPLVFVLHGDGGDGASARATMKLEAPAREGAVFVYPDGRNKNWDLDTMPPSSNPDALFFDGMVARLGESLCLARGRVFVTGHSNGAYMANQLGCWRGGVVRAVAPHSGGGPYDSTNKSYDERGDLVCPGSPVAAMVIHGQADGTVAPSESQFTVGHWRRLAGCQNTIKGMDAKPPLPDACVAYTGCPTRPLVACSVPGLGHSVWPQAPQLIWDFFARLP